MSLDMPLFLLVAAAFALRRALALRASAITQAIAFVALFVGSCLVSLQVLGVYSALTRQPVVTPGLGAVLLGLVLVVDLAAFGRLSLRRPRFQPVRPDPWVLAMGAVAAIAAAMALRYGLTHPPIGWDLQHYHVPRALNIMQTHTLTEYYPPPGYTFKHLENALGYATIRAYPGNWSLWLSILAIPRQETLLAVAAFPFALVGGLVAYRLARLLGAERAPAMAALVAYATSPLVLQQGVHPYADMFCASWILAALMFMLERPQGMGCYALAGLCMGLALGAKSTSLIYALVLGMVGAVTLAIRQREAPGRVLGMLGLFAGMTLLPSAFWFGQDWLLYGSPVLPFRLRLFGVTIFPGLDPATFGAMQEGFYVHARQDWLLYPWRERFSLESGYGWLFATLLPLAAVTAVRSLRAPFLRLDQAAVTACWVGTVAVWWTMTHHEPRYMLHVVGLVAVLGAVELGRLPARARLVAVVMVLVGSAGNALGVAAMNRMYDPGGTRSAEVGWIGDTPPAVIDRLDALPPGRVYYEIHDGPGPVYYALYGDHIQHRLLDDQNLVDEDVSRFRARLADRNVDYLYVVVRKGSAYLDRYSALTGFVPLIVTERGEFQQALFTLHGVSEPPHDSRAGARM